MFNGIWLVAAEPLTVGSHEYQAGERFEISRTQAGALIVTGKATIDKIQKRAIQPDPPRRRRGRPRKTTQPDSPETPQASASDGEIETPRHYQRRDLEAE